MAQPDIPIYAAPEITDKNIVSRIVIARGRGITGFAYKFYITLDGVEIAALKPLQYAEVLIDAGPHSLEVKTYLPNIYGFGGYGGAIVWFSPGDWRLVSLKEEFKTGSEYRFLVTYDIWNSKGKIEKVEYFPKYIRLDQEKKVPTGTMKGNSELLAP
ncbi:hypothetical protein ACFL0Q_02400 [Thermodesulfobacteriota bacterium]